MSPPGSNHNDPKEIIMADTILHVAPTASNRELASAYFEGALAFEDLALDIERARDTAHTLACSQSFGEREQNVLYAIGELCDRIHAKTKKFEDKFSSMAETRRRAAE
jgi:hypothetical protein